LFFSKGKVLFQIKKPPHGWLDFETFRGNYGIRFVTKCFQQSRKAKNEWRKANGWFSELPPSAAMHGSEIVKPQPNSGFDQTGVSPMGLKSPWAFQFWVAGTVRTLQVAGSLNSRTKG
jgi:hypothetical protein